MIRNRGPRSAQRASRADTIPCKDQYQSIPEQVWPTDLIRSRDWLSRWERYGNIGETVSEQRKYLLINSPMIVRLHRFNALILVAFLTAHLTDHLAAGLGPEAHGTLATFLRRGYRTEPVQSVLICLFIVQVLLGTALLWRRSRERAKGIWSWVQLLSGGYLGLFILNHIFFGVLRGRTYEGVDTGFHFVAATLTTEPALWFFRPYYVLAVTAIFG